LPAALKLKVLQEKYLLKKAAGHLVPPAVSRRPKQPYRAPDARSFYDAAAGRQRGDYVAELLSPASVKDVGLFNPQAVDRLVHKARGGQLIGAGDNMALVGILSTQLLARQFVHSQGRWS
jgi:asparagine synthase (glutamine-hydrolysing)